MNRKRATQLKLGKRFYQMVSSVPKRTWARSLLIASLLALLSFPVWQLIFTNLKLPVQIQMATDKVEYVRAYWDDPVRYPHAYERIPVALNREPVSRASTVWQIKVEALAQKVPQAKSSQVWVLDVRTPENQIDWSKTIMQPQQWQLMAVPNAPQGKAAVALTEKPQSLQVVTKGSAVTVVLLRHPWSGRVRVTANDQVRELDLFGTNATTEALQFNPVAVETKKAELYEIRVVKTLWHRLRLVSEPATDSSHQIRVDSVQVGDTVILAQTNGEFILPFYFWNQFSCTVATTVLGFLGLASLLIAVSYTRQQNPEFLQWQWFDLRNQPRAILKVKVAKQQFLILPYQSFKYLLIVLAILTIGLVLTESYFHHLEAGKVIKVRSQQRNQVADLPFAIASATQAAALPKSHSPKLASQVWHAEDDRIFLNNNKKILTTGDVFHPSKGDWVWRSIGFPVGQVAQKPNRILVMGDSFVWGDGYANMNDIWWRQLQRELMHRGYNDVEVIAAGLNGASTHEELEQARHLVHIYKPNLIIWGYVTNDPDERVVKNFDNRLADEDAIISTFNTLEAKEIFPRLSAFLNAARTRKVAQKMSGDTYGYEYTLWSQRILEGKNFELYRKTVQALAAFQTDSGIPGFVLTLPSAPTPDAFAANYSQVMPLFQTAKIPAHDILNDYLKYYSALNLDSIYGWRINPANGHPATASTYFYAVKATDFLEANYAPVLGKRSVSSNLPTVQINDWVPYSLNPTTNKAGVFTFQYPTSPEFMLRLPVNRPFVQFNLEAPVALKEVRLSGTGLQAAALDMTIVNSALKFDDSTVYSFGAHQGSSLVWNLEGQAIAKAVNTIRLSASFQNQDRQLTLTLIPMNAGGQP